MMEKKEKIDRLLFGLFLGLALASAWASWTLFDSSSDKGRTLIGKTLSTTNIVQRKSKGDLFFQPISTQADLFLRDHITTSAGSSTEVQFIDGGKLSLRELSHVILDRQQQITSIAIEFGRVEVNLIKDESILIDGEKIVKPTSDQVKLQYSKSGEGAEILLLDGEVEIEKGTEKKTISAEEGAGYWSTDGNFYNLERIRILSPSAQQVIELTTDKMNINWTPIEGVSSYVVRLYQDQDSTQASPAKENQIEIEITETGNYEVLVEGIAEDRVTARSELLPFRVIRMKSLQQVSPKNESLVANDPDRTQIQFEWIPVEDQILRLEVQKQDLDGTWSFHSSADLDLATKSRPLELPTGTFRWKLSVLKPTEMKYQDSDWAEFSVLEKQWPLIAAPRLQKVDRPWEPTDAQGVKILWNKGPDDFSYEIEINSQQFQTVQPEFKFPARQPLSTSYRVRVLNKNRKPGSWSRPQTFRLTKKEVAVQAEPAPTTTTLPSLPAPIAQVPARIQKPLIPINNVPIPEIKIPRDGSTLQIAKDTKDIPIQLSRLSACESYEIEIDDSPKFFAASVFKEDDENITAAVNQGKKFMRARCWRNGQFGTWTRPISFEVQ